MILWHICQAFNFSPTPYAHIWACPTMESRAIGSKFKLCHIWSYYIPFKPKFYSEQLFVRTLYNENQPFSSYKLKCEGN